ncbi:MAG: SpoIIE family protein phosphatase [Chitinispirillia bacterium]|jgi:serine phosphatase RsbU (regulator of sigma subunit)/DNA-binding LacI/PurR family transcriptional regulator
MKSFNYKNNNFPTVGILTEGLIGVYQAGLWPGIKDTAKTNNINLICFCGGSLGVSSENPWDYQGNILYKLVEENTPDGLIIAGSLGCYLTENRIADFLNKFSNTPVITLAPTVESIPAVFVDNSSGMRSLILHLIEHHNYKKIAFIRGPEGNIEAEERYSHFCEILLEHNIIINQDLVFPGNFTRKCGEEAVHSLLKMDENIEAIVAAADETALGALETLKKLGKNVPGDIAVVGFDDIEEGQYITPPLTTVNQPMYTIGKTSIETILNLINGKDVPNKITLKAKLLIRQSCGCFHNPPDIKKINSAVSSDNTLKRKLSEKDVFNCIMKYMDHSYAERTREIVSDFCKDVNSRQSLSFLKKVDSIGRGLVLKDKKLSAWHYIFFELWYYALTHLNTEAFAFADDILHMARVIRGDVSLREQGFRRIQTQRRGNFLHKISDVFQNTLSVTKLMDAVNTQLPQLGFKSFFISLYDSTDKRANPESRLMLANVDGKKMDVGSKGILYDTNQILPKNIISAEKKQILIVEPLYFQEEQFGLLILENNEQESFVYEVLRDYISSALHSAYLLEKVQKQTDILIKSNIELENLRKREHEYLQAIKNELELGRKIQMGFLPQELPKLNGWEISFAFSPAREVSGDFYDVFMLQKDIVILIIADVSGKDVSAALFMSLIRTLLRVFSERAYSEGNDPLDAIEVVNDYIIQHHRQGDGRCMFATIVFGLLKPSTGEFTYINAGHNSPYLVYDSDIKMILDPTGPAVGLAADMTFKKKKIIINPGEMVFTYTDGVTEAQNPDGEFFSSERLVKLLKKEYSKVDEKVNQIHEALYEYTKNTTPYDDITMLAVKRK